MKLKRRLGLILISFLLIGNGAWNVSYLLRIMPGSWSVSSFTIVIFPLLFILLGLSAVGLCWWDKWARKIVMSLSWLVIFFYFILWIVLIFRQFSLVTEGELLDGSAAMGATVLFLILVIYYLHHPEVREHFK